MKTQGLKSKPRIDFRTHFIIQKKKETVSSEKATSLMTGPSFLKNHQRLFLKFNMRKEERRRRHTSSFISKYKHIIQRKSVILVSPFWVLPLHRQVFIHENLTFRRYYFVVLLFVCILMACSLFKVWSLMGCVLNWWIQPFFVFFLCFFQWYR